MKVVVSVIAILGVIVIAGLMTIGVIAPETSVYLGRQLPTKYVNEIEDLGLLKSDEELVYFYTDGFIDITEGLYFVTDKNLVLYSTLWDEPETIIPYHMIDSLAIDYVDTFLEDSYAFVRTVDGLEVSFPISNEKNRDELFYEYIESKVTTDSNLKAEN